MFDAFLTEPFVPFTLSLALLFGLLALELLLALLGGSLLGMGADADIDVDIEAGALGDLDLDAADLAEVEFADLDANYDTAQVSATAAGPASWLGFGKVPIMIWIAALLLGFGIAGLVLQQMLGTIFGFALPASIAVVPAAFAGIWFARTFSAAFARILPKTETTALSSRHLGRRTGTVTQGTAQRSNPAEVRVTDRHGNFHYLRAEPLKDADRISAGTSVLVLRHRKDQGYRLVPLGSDA